MPFAQINHLVKVSKKAFYDSNIAKADSQKSIGGTNTSGKQLPLPVSEMPRYFCSVEIF